MRSERWRPSLCVTDQTPTSRCDTSMTMIAQPTRMDMAPNSRCNKARSTNAKFPTTADTTLPNGSTSSGGSQRAIEAIELATPGRSRDGFPERTHPPFHSPRVFLALPPGWRNTGLQVDPRPTLLYPGSEIQSLKGKPLILRSCLVCGRPTQRSRCPDHPRPEARRNQRLRRAVASTAIVCPVCGDYPTRANPMTADHINPQINGGQDTPSNPRPMCRRCNSQRGRGGVATQTQTTNAHPANFPRETFVRDE